MEYGPPHDRKKAPRGGPPPCWSCPKWSKEVPDGEKHPLDEGADFGPWFYDAMQWYREGRELGFGEVDPNMRAVAAAIGTAERDADKVQSQRMILEVLRVRR